MPTLEDVKSALTKLDDGQELYEVVSNAVLQERTKGKGLVKDVQRKYDAIISGIKGLGFDPTTSDIENFVSELSDKIKTGAESKKKLTTEQQRIADLEKNIESLTTKWTKSEQAAEDFRTKYTSSVLKDQLLGKMKGKIYSADVRAKDLIREGCVILDEDGKTAKWKNGDEVVDLETGLQPYYEANKEDLVNAQKGGGGGSGGGGNAGTKTMARAAFSQLTPQDQLATVKEGVEITD